MTAAEQVKAARKFAAKWMKDCKEDGNTAPFWISLLREIFGVADTDSYIRFEDTVKHEEKGNSLFIDGWIPSMRIMIEQKASGVPLDKPYKRHGRTFASAYEQAFEYDQTLPVSQRSRYIVTSNFHEIWIYNMDEPEAARKPMKLTLADLPEHFHQLDFLVDEKAKPREMEEIKVSVKAGELVGRLYDALLQQYRDPKSEASQKSLNVLCVRIVFCLYAEDSGLFGAKNSFSSYLEGWRWENARDALQQLFRVLDTKVEDRDPYLKEDLMAFPYVNGGLFHDEHIEIPRITKEIFDIIVEDMSKGFDWHAISPTIFGAVFESTLNPETRRSGGMHYTSIANIHKVIDPLFLDDLEKEFQEILSLPEEQKTMRGRKEYTLRYDYRNHLEAFQKKLASLTFLDPAAGSGNFLTETFLSLRRLENRVIDALTGGQQLLDVGTSPIKVSISQFYGIEINDFAVTVAKTALWIAESQMMQETEHIVKKNLDFLPLKTNAFIHEGNALRMDWETVIPKDKLSYIMGNPPFVGARLMDKIQKADMEFVFGRDWKNVGDLDYVTAWYKKAADYIEHSFIECAFVSTNTITQGLQPAFFLKPLMESGIIINFAYRTFYWDSEATLKAHVHCVIIGFSRRARTEKVIYSEFEAKRVKNINGYLSDYDNVFIISRKHPLCPVPEIGIGNKPIDGGFYLFEEEEMKNFLQKEPRAKAFFHPWYGAKDFINNHRRYCLYLGECSNNELRKMPECMKRITAVRDYRLQSKSPGTKKLANTPTKFHVTNIFNGSFLVIPEVSSQRRKYIPMGYMGQGILCSNEVRIMPNGNMYHFGVLESNVHMAWMRAVAGRLKSDYRYSINIVYNNFPWPSPTEEQKARIEKTAQGILDARAKYPNDSLADLYDPLLMPADLRRAQAENDKAVMDAYGFPWRTMKEEDCVAELMRMYQRLVEEGSR